MKTAEAKISSTTTHLQKKESKPFFAKNGRESFFSKSVDTSQSFFNPPAIQTKLTVGQPNDKYEQEADAMADKVVQRLATPEVLTKKENAIQAKPLAATITPLVQTKCASCEQEERLQKKEEDVVQESPLQLHLKPIFESNAEQPDADIQSKPLTTPVLQAKCDSCEQEEKLQKKEVEFSDNGLSLQRKTADLPSENSPDLESKLSSSKGSGSNLSPFIQSSMGHAFGTDFSNVRVHTDSKAVQMNKELNAQAFTHGSDIYFNEGKYDTNSNSGKHLLAHELSHTIQQNGQNSVQRATDPEFRITGKYEGAAADPDSVYFDYNSSIIDSDEEAKITTLASSVSQNYDLVGFSSEEGGNTGNRQLTAMRLNAVWNSFDAKGHTGARNKRNEFQRGDNKLDYRRLRRVDVLLAGMPSTEPDCLAGPVASCGTTFTDAHPLALTQALRAYMLMIMAPFIGEQSRIENAVAAFFGDVIYYNDIKGHLGNLVAQIADQPNTVRCHNSCDRTCEQAVAYMDDNTGPGAVLTLCSPFYTNSNPVSNAETLIHEALHATVGLATEDLAYGSERGITFLDSATALRNTDSYVLFIKELLNPGSVLGGGGGNRDVIDASITGTQLADLRRVMAYLEKWVIESTAEISSLYDIIVEVIGAGTWSGVSFSYYQATMSFLAPLFGLTAPTAVPNENDQVRVAGIYDRLLRMDSLLWETNIEIKKDPGPVRFTAGPTDPLFVNDVFLTSGQHAMVYTLLREIVEGNTSISGGHKAKYVDLIERIRVHAGHAAPP